MSYQREKYDWSNQYVALCVGIGDIVEGNVSGLGCWDQNQN